MDVKAVRKVGRTRNHKGGGTMDVKALRKVYLEYVRRYGPLYSISHFFQDHPGVTPEEVLKALDT